MLNPSRYLGVLFILTSQFMGLNQVFAAMKDDCKFAPKILIENLPNLIDAIGGITDHLNPHDLRQYDDKHFETVLTKIRSSGVMGHLERNARTTKYSHEVKEFGSLRGNLDRIAIDIAKVMTLLEDRKLKLKGQELNVDNPSNLLMRGIEKQIALTGKITKTCGAEKQYELHLKCLFDQVHSFMNEQLQSPTGGSPNAIVAKATSEKSDHAVISTPEKSINPAAAVSMEKSSNSVTTGSIEKTSNSVVTTSRPSQVANTSLRSSQTNIPASESSANQVASTSVTTHIVEQPMNPPAASTASLEDSSSVLYKYPVQWYKVGDDYKADPAIESDENLRLSLGLPPKYSPERIANQNGNKSDQYTAKHLVGLSDETFIRKYILEMNEIEKEELLNFYHKDIDEVFTKYLKVIPQAKSVKAAENARAQEPEELKRLRRQLIRMAFQFQVRHLPAALRSSNTLAPELKTKGVQNLFNDLVTDSSIKYKNLQLQDLQKNIDKYFKTIQGVTYSGAMKSSQEKKNEIEKLRLEHNAKLAASGQNSNSSSEVAPSVKGNQTVLMNTDVTIEPSLDSAVKGNTHNSKAFEIMKKAAADLNNPSNAASPEWKESVQAYNDLVQSKKGGLVVFPIQQQVMFAPPKQLVMMKVRFHEKDAPAGRQLNALPGLVERAHQEKEEAAKKESEAKGIEQKSGLIRGKYFTEKDGDWKWGYAFHFIDSNKLSSFMDRHKGENLEFFWNDGHSSKKFLMAFPVGNNQAEPEFLMGGDLATGTSVSAEQEKMGIAIGRGDGDRVRHIKQTSQGSKILDLRNHAEAFGVKK